MAIYTTHVERILHNLKIIGFLPKEQNRDPELNGIFVPLRIALTDDTTRTDKQHSQLIELLERYHYIVLLGDPGSGKSTVVRHLAWSHAYANMAPSEQAQEIPLLSRCPLPLRIELRLFTQSRKHHPDHSFLSYATGVLLKQENIAINPLMFERLLAQKRMLLLFDGLDEVTTLDERQRLVQEIEHFAQHYPGNHILVTSRPAGYELARCSKQLFTHAQVQKFDDDQIHQFLERWYEFVLRLSPLPYEEQQELETLFGILKENTRLHRLAENPLLLTVITALYRSQRLPEKRVQVYDECAKLLLATWANIKGTNTRWSEMKLGRDDQFACVAHLGFKLHQRSQDESAAQAQNRPDAKKDTATDVPARLLLREIENFLDSRKLISEKAERRKEAERFLSLMQMEAGLIVERGTDENGENIYGFVHRTFQEYFAAADVYERYRQDEDPEIIKDFLVEHLHDPHWQEVILLLLGKLGRKPVTLRLREILNGTIKSRRSRYTDLVQQDLFFVADCLIEELPVESDLAELVIARLSEPIVTSPFSSQRYDAVEKLGKLIQTKQCSDIASKELMSLVKLDTITDIDLKIEMVRALYGTCFEDSAEKQEARQVLIQLAQRKDIPVEMAIQAAGLLYEFSAKGSEEGQEAKKMLISLVRQEDILAERAIKGAEALYSYSPENSEGKQEALQLLMGLIRHEDTSVEQIIKAARVLYRCSSESSNEIQEATQTLMALAQGKDITVEQVIEIAVTLYDGSAQDMQEAVRILIGLARQEDILVEQAIKAAKILYIASSIDSEEEQEARQILTAFAHRGDIPIEQVIEATEGLYRWHSESTVEGQDARRILRELAHCEDITIEQTIRVVEILYDASAKDSEEHQLALQMLLQLMQDERTTEDQRLYIIAMPITTWYSTYLDKAQTLEKLFALLTEDQITNYVEKRWPHTFSSEIQPEEIPHAAAIAKQQLLPLRVRDDIYFGLRISVPQFDKIPPSDDTITL